MKKSTRLVFLLFISGLLAINAFSQKNFWTDISEAKAKNPSYKRVIIPDRYRTLSLEVDPFLAELKKAPKEFSVEAQLKPLIIALPFPDGSTRHFSIVEYSMMEPGLAEKFPDMKTFSGQGIEDKTATIKIDWTEFGFHAMVLSDVTGSVWIDPYARGEKKNYIAYYKKDLKPRMHEETGILETAYAARETSTLSTLGACRGASLRSYRAAVSCTGEYAVAVCAPNTPTAQKVHSAIVTTMNRVNGIYESELSIRLVLISNNTVIEFLNPSTDPYKFNSTTSGLIDESQTVIDSRIGILNYDVGHTFCTAAGGLAQLGSVCSGSFKARGVTGLPNPVGDAFDVDFVSHEFGHQFGARHTFNNNTAGSCTNNASALSNVEPGSGSTIMAYSGQCTSTNNLQRNSDPYFHGFSFDLINSFLTGGGGSKCGTVITTNNAPPSVNAGADYTIPVSTPFMLTGSATDANGDAITYSWEQIDFGGPFSNWDAPSGAAPLFRSFAPSISETRIFPRISDIVNNTRTIGEILPNYARKINFKLTARDNKSGGGGVCSDEMVITTAGTAPFKVTSQSAATTWSANGNNKATITWDVVGTTAAPYNVTAVDILFSTDGGYTYPYTLITNTPNDGTEDLTIPSVPTITGRVMVKARGNVFFNINSANITIVSGCLAEGALVKPATPVTAPAGSPSLNLGLAPEYSTPITISGTLTTTDPKMNLTINNSTTSPTSCNTFPNEVRYDVFNFTPSLTGTYTFDITPTNKSITMNLYTGSFDANSPCANFLRSNSRYTTSFSYSASMSQALTGGQPYVLVIMSFNPTTPTLPAQYSVAVTNFQGGKLYAGSNIYVNPGSSFSYGYVVVNNANNTIKSITSGSNLSNAANYPAGNYTVYGFSYASSQTNLNSLVGGSFNTLLINILYNPTSFCGNLSKNSVQVNVTSGQLPVGLMKLNARKNGNGTLLEWSTSFEQNSAYFNVQRSADGVNFSDILGKVKAAGNSNTLLNYRFNDNQPISNWNYYRLEQVDINMEKKYSNIVAVNFDKSATPLLVYPNPAKDNLNIEFNASLTGYLTLQILDSKGALVKSQRIMSVPGRVVDQIDISNLSSGIYMVRMAQPNGAISNVKFVKR